MAKKRSPNYPTIDLSDALDLIGPVFAAEDRNKMSRLVFAQHLGYTSLNGRALGKIGAIRAFGLIEGSGDDLRVSHDAITALNAPTDSIERQEAIERSAFKSTLFQDLRTDFPDSPPSMENLRFSLIQRGFTGEAAEKAAGIYLATLRMASGNSNKNGSDEIEDVKGGSSPTPIAKSPSAPLNPRYEHISMDHERELATGILSKDSAFRLIVRGRIGVKEIERLIRKLEFDKDILADAEDDECEEVSTYYPE